MLFRNLKANEIECKVAQVKESGVQLLLYKTARTDMDLLDEVVGTTNWKCSYREIKGNLYCTISIYDKEKQEWVEKEDCGVESAFGDKEKGEASDAFKRAGFKIGIGRSLYTSPFIWVGSDKVKINGGKTYDTFSVLNIEYDTNGDISVLEIINSRTKELVYTFGSAKKVEKQVKKITQAQYDQMEAIGVNIHNVMEKLGLSTIMQLDYDTAQKIIQKKLNATAL